MYINSWVDAEFGQVPISDERIVKRLIKTTEKLYEYPHLSIPQACGDWKTTKGAYRLIDNEKLTPDAIITSHRCQTIERMKGHSTVLILQDTMHADFSDHPQTQGLGLYSNSQEAKGLLLHSAFAVTTSGVPLGIMNEEFWTRKIKQEDRDHGKLPIEEKESYKWLKALDSGTRDIPTEIMAVTVCDREADIYEFFGKAISEGKHLLVRASTTDRRILGEYKTLAKEVENHPSAGEVIVKLPRNANNNSPEREARLSIKFCPVTIVPPKKLKNAKSLPDLQLYAILAEETSILQKGVKSIYWLLLTTLSVNTAEEAVEKMQWYTKRWKIERFHLTLKSGCKIEDRQFETFERLQNAIALYSVIAWRLLWLTYESRENPDTSCELIFKTYEWQALYCFINKTPVPPNKVPTIKEALVLVAKLGGFLARKHDGEPGVIVLWRGMSRLNDIAQTWAITHPQLFSNDVGNA